MPETTQTSLQRCAEPSCQQPFLARTPWQKYHSPQCRLRHWRSQHERRPAALQPRGRARRRNPRRARPRVVVLILD